MPPKFRTSFAKLLVRYSGCRQPFHLTVCRNRHRPSASHTRVAPSGTHPRPRTRPRIGMRTAASGRLISRPACAHASNLCIANGSPVTNIELLCQLVWLERRQHAECRRRRTLEATQAPTEAATAAGTARPTSGRARRSAGVAEGSARAMRSSIARVPTRPLCRGRAHMLVPAKVYKLCTSQSFRGKPEAAIGLAWPPQA